MPKTLIPFTDQELQLNKQGKLSEKQRLGLIMTAKGMQSSSIMTIKITCVFLLIGTLLIGTLFFQNESTRKALFSNSSHFIILALVLLIIILLLGLSKYMSRNRAQTLLEGEIQHTQGVATLDENYSYGAAFYSYQLLVGDKKFSFTQKLEPYFSEGQSYRIFYVKAGVIETILSYEKLSEKR